MKRIQQLLKLLIFLWSFSLFSVQAGYFTYITKSGPSPEISGNIRYDYVVEYWNEPSYKPNPCKSLGLSGRCYIQLNHFHAKPDKGGTGTEHRARWRCDVDLQNLNSMAEIRDVAVNQCGLTFPYVNYSTHAGPVNVDECIAFFMTSSATGGSGRMVPGGVCGIAPPPEGKCAFVSNNLTISHGVLDVTQVHGNKAEAQFALTCNESMPIKITSSMQTAELYLKADKSIASLLTINNYLVASGIDVYAQKNEYTYVTVKSTLQAIGTPSLGNFSGTTTLILSIP